MTVDKKLTFSNHIRSMVAKAHSRVYLLFKSFISMDQPTLVRAFTTFVRPLVEYASCVWSPTSVSDIKKIEAVQRRFTKRLKGLQTLSYKERLSVLNLESLELRRLHCDLVSAYKIIFGHLKIDCNQFFSISSERRTRGHHYRLRCNVARTETRRRFFAYRVVKPWNILPADIVDFTTVSSFKQSLKYIDFSAFLHF